MKEPPKLGELTSPEEHRDAIHIAVAPVQADHELSPGDRVCLGPRRMARSVPDECDEWIGIVDPFLDHNVKQGQWFWLCMRPNTIESLRHAWTHSAFRPEIPCTKTREN